MQKFAPKSVSKSFKAVAVLFALMVSNGYAAPVTNKDVINLLDAGMSEDVIIQAINTGEPKFDTSSSALIKLKQKGATPTILKLILAPKSIGGSAEKTKTASAGNTVNPEEVTLSQGGQDQTMQYVVPSMRTAARALGFGGVASYAVLQGDHAALRLKTPSPEFLVSVPKNAQAPNYLTLANFAVRKNSTREVSTGGGYMSYSTGISRNRVVAVTTEQLADQSHAHDGFILYKVKPVEPLPSGEYALVLYTGEVRTIGFFASASNSFFDLVSTER